MLQLSGCATNTRTSVYFQPLQRTSQSNISYIRRLIQDQNTVTATMIQSVRTSQALLNVENLSRGSAAVEVQEHTSALNGKLLVTKPPGLPTKLTGESDE